MKFAELLPELEAHGHKLSFDCPLHRGERLAVPVHPIEGRRGWIMTGALPDITLDASIQISGHHDGHPCNAHFTVNAGNVTVLP